MFNAISETFLDPFMRNVNYLAQPQPLLAATFRVNRHINNRVAEASYPLKRDFLRRKIAPLLMVGLREALALMLRVKAKGSDKGKEIIV